MPDVKDMNYSKLLLEAMRMVSYKKGDGMLTNEGLTKAMTLNENLLSLGYTLNPNDIIKMASSPSVDDLYEKIKEITPTVKAKPMYPDFPKQVMEMDEAQFRMHQMMHYFSTYGLEFLTGQEVLKGWLPAEAGLVSDTEKTEADTRLLEANALELIEEENQYIIPFERILHKRERMTDMEEEIIKQSVESGKIPFDKKWEIPFKENTEPVFQYIAEAGANGKIPREEASKGLYNICQHPGDVTKNIQKYLISNKFELRTIEKKMFVDTYEYFTNKSFIENTQVTAKKAKSIKEVFKRIDFSKYAHNNEMKDAVTQIGKTLSWEARARQMLEREDPNAIDFISKRPGMLIRVTSMALRNGYSEEDIASALAQKSDQISLQTTVEDINKIRGHYVQPKGFLKKNKILNDELMKARQALRNIELKESRYEDKENTTRDPYAELREIIKKLSKSDKLSSEEKGQLQSILEKQDNKDKNLSKIKSYIEKRIKKTERQIDKLELSEALRVEMKEKTKDAVERIFTKALEKRLAQIQTGIRGKNIYLDEKCYDFSRFEVDPSKKSKTQGYLPSATVAKIPEGIDRVRCFVYWNDQRRIDLDLHCTAKGYKYEDVFIPKEEDIIHVGWDGDFNKGGIVFSGDFTHSDAAEYIDVDIKNTTVKYVKMSLHSFPTIPDEDAHDWPKNKSEHFKNIEECFMGIMAVDKLGERVQLYNPENCFFSNEINNDSTTILYGELDVEHRTLKYLGLDQNRDDIYTLPEVKDEKTFSLKEYLTILAEAQNATIVDDPDKADAVLTLCKPMNEKEISLIDNNFFYDAPIEKRQNEKEITIENASTKSEMENAKKKEDKKVPLGEMFLRSERWNLADIIGDKKVDKDKPKKPDKSEGPDITY